MKSLAFFLVFFFGVSLFTGTAQIYYTNVDPDMVLTAPSSGGQTPFLFDMNRDGIDDFYVEHFDFDGHHPAADAYCNNVTPPNYTCNILVGFDGLGAALSYNTLIGPNTTGSWISTISGGDNYPINLSDTDDDTYPWHDAVDKYLGVNMEIGGNTHYGWIRMDIAPGTASITVKEFALDMTPNTPIHAGDKGTVSVDRPRAATNDFSIYTRGKTLIVEAIADAGALRKGEIAVYTLLGSKIASKPMESRYESVSLQHYPVGSYLVTVRTGEQVQTALVCVW